jgi:ParB/RepB/Spo0J family partition protein
MTKNKRNLTSLLDNVGADAKKGDDGASDSPSSNNQAQPPRRVSMLDRAKGSPTSRRGNLLTVETDACVMWSMADRICEGLDDSSLFDLGESIRRHKQFAPVIARRISPERKKEQGLPEAVMYEIIAGRRRFEACKFVGIDILILLQDMDDSTAFAVMVSENDDREDIAPFTRALSFASALEKGIYKNQVDLVKHHNSESSSKRYTKGAISKMLTAAKIANRPWLWDKLQSFDVSSVPVILAYNLEVALSNNPDAVGAAKKCLSSTKADTPSKLLSDLIAAISQPAATSAKGADVSFKVGDRDASLSLTPKGATFTVKGGALKREDIDSLLSSLREKLEESL